MPAANRLTRALRGAVALAAAVLVLGAAAPRCGTATPAAPTAPAAPVPAPSDGVPIGAYLGSDAEGVERVAGFQEWLGREVTVGHTYLPGTSREDVRGPDYVLDPWTAWRAADPRRLLVLNVPVLVPNEDGSSDEEVRGLLARGASGEFDGDFRTLAERLVAKGAPDTVVVPAWEFNGVTYTSRCAPDPEAWKAYWRRIVEAMRAVPGQAFRFEFTPSRGTDAIPWTECYPGDDVVDVIGMDSYDQAPGDDFDDYVSQPYGLQAQVDFAAERGKPVSYAEWGLFRYGDRPEFVRRMAQWVETHDVLYHTITDYCPHGVWRCTENPESSAAFREVFGG